VRHGFEHYPILHPLDFQSTIEDARETRRAEQDARKRRQQELEQIALGNTVVAAIRRITAGQGGGSTIATLKRIRVVAAIGERKAEVGIAWALGGGRIEEYEAIAKNNRGVTAYRLTGCESTSAETPE
jgi:hypothetical protein